MSTLHVVNKSPFDRRSLESCVGHLVEGDAVLLIEDAVVAAKRGSAAVPILEKAMRAGPVYVLGPDLAARAIRSETILPGMQVVDYRGFVDLTVQHTCTHSWL